jgi:hypothetical protein
LEAGIVEVGDARFGVYDAGRGQPIVVFLQAEAVGGGGALYRGPIIMTDIGSCYL